VQTYSGYKLIASYKWLFEVKKKKFTAIILI